MNGPKSRTGPNLYYRDSGCFGKDSGYAYDSPYEVNFDMTSTFFRSSSATLNESSRILLPSHLMPEAFCPADTSSIGSSDAYAFSSLRTDEFSLFPEPSASSSKDSITVLKRHAFLSSPN